MIEFEFDIAQQIKPWNMPWHDVDVVVCLSGRGTFKHYISDPDRLKLKRNENEIDPHDTYRRLEFAIAFAKEQTRLNQKNGNNRSVTVYFNGVAQQNFQLRNVLKSSTKFLGYPSELIVVDDIPFDNTIGQCISLRLYLESNVDKFGIQPRLLFVSSTYHMPRALRTFGNDSPLLSPEFYRANQEFMRGLQARCTYDKFKELREHLFADNCVLKQAIIMGYGIDDSISSRPGWQLDMKGELDAIPFYSQRQEIPSIARMVPDNVLTFQYALVRSSLALATQFKYAQITDYTEPAHRTGLRLKEQ